LFGKETSVDGGKVRLSKEEGEGSRWLDYMAVRLHGSYYGAFFLDNQALINYANSQPLSEVLTCLGDGHDGICNIILQLNPDGAEPEILDGYHEGGKSM
jgi:hypothetical protein